MNREAVQHERGPRNATIRKQMEDMSTLGLTFPSPPRMINPYSSLHNPFIPFVSSPANLFPKLETPSPPSSPIPSNFLTNSFLPLTPPPSNNLPKSEVCEVAAKILYMTAQRVRSVPSYLRLSPEDQATLFKQSWRKLFTIGCAQFLTVPDLEQFHSSASVQEHEISSFISSVSTLRSLGLSPAEYACLRAVLLFQCEDGTAYLARHSIAANSEQAVLTLAQAQPARFPRIMMVLARIEDVLPDTLHHLFFRDTIGDVDIQHIVMDILGNVK